MSIIPSVELKMESIFKKFFDLEEKMPLEPDGIILGEPPDEFESNVLSKENKFFT